jgi:uncharacterized protein (DUF58 family)
MKKNYIYFILPIIIGIIASATGFSLVWRLFILSILVPAVSYWWSYSNIRGIRCEVKSQPPKSHAGDVLETGLKLININRFPKLLLRVQEKTDLPGYTGMTTVNIPSRGEAKVESSVVCTRRGQYSLGSYTISSSDPLGLFPQSKKFGEPQKILVYPNTVELPFFDPLTYINLGYGSGRWLESQISPNVASIREYVSGDSLRRIHWQTTAHSSKLMVKVFDPDRSQSQARTIWIALDMSHSAQAGSGLQSTEEYGITIAASLLKKFIDNGWPVGFIAAAEKSYLFPLDTGSPHLESITAALVAMKAQGDLPVDQLLAAESSRLSMNTMLIVITPSWSEKLITPFTQIKTQQGVAVAVLLDPDSFENTDRRSVIPRSLVLNEIQTYVVRKGDNLATVLDSRNLAVHGV